jgi:hypothetical protein
MPESPDISQLQDRVFELVQRSQEAMLDASRSFAERVSSLAPGDTEAVDKLLDDAFDFTERVLRSQRDFAKSVVQAVGSTATGSRQSSGGTEA